MIIVFGSLASGSQSKSMFDFRRFSNCVLSQLVEKRRSLYPFKISRSFTCDFDTSFFKGDISVERVVVIRYFDNYFQLRHTSVIEKDVGIREESYSSSRPFTFGLLLNFFCLRGVKSNTSN